MDVMENSVKTYNGIVLEKHRGGWRIYNTERWWPNWDDACYGVDKWLKSLKNLKVEKPKP